MDRDKLSTLGLTRDAGRDRALQRLRHAAGLADLRAEQPVPGDPAVAPEFQSDPARCRCCTCDRSRTADPARIGGAKGTAVGPFQVNHFGQLPSVTMSFNLARARARRCGGADQRRRSDAAASIIAAFQGTAQAFQDSLRGLGLVLLMAIVVIYIVLGVLYESFTHR
jgi:HAE1 family hydrophobic/amphiphilic exporter-1